MNIIKPAWHWRIPPETDPLYLPNVDGIALHHMAHPTADIWDIEKWHLERDGGTWKGFAYNFFVCLDGTVYIGRGFNTGAGVSNENWHLISIGFQGNYHPSDKIAANTKMPEEQLKAGVELIAWVKAQLPRKDIIVDGHKRWEPTGCPGDYFPLARMIGGVSVLKIGSFGEEVKQLQEKLNKLGYNLNVDGDFGPATNKAVTGFQSGNGLDPDGVVGPATIEKLDEMISRLTKVPEVDYKVKFETLLQGLQALVDQYQYKV